MANNTEYLTTVINLEIPKLGMIDKLNKKIDNLSENIGKVGKSFKGLSNVMLQAGLSMLFTGMAIKRFADNAIRGMVTMFMQVADHTNAGLKRTMELQAAFIYLKFAIFNALANSDLFAMFVTFLVEAVLWVTQFIEKHPGLTKIFGIFLLIAVVLGGIFMVLGQIVLAVLGFISVLTGLGSAIGTSVVGAFITLLTIVLGVVFFLVVLIGTLWLLSQKVGGVKNAFKALGIFLLAILAFIGDAIYETMMLPLRAVIQLINLLIKGWNAIASTKVGKKFGMSVISEISQPEFAPLSHAVWEKRNALLAEGTKANQLPETPTNKLVELGDSTINKLTSGLGDRLNSQMGGIIPSVDR